MPEILFDRAADPQRIAADHLGRRDATLLPGFIADEQSESYQSPRNDKPHSTERLGQFHDITNNRKYRSATRRDQP